MLDVRVGADKSVASRALTQRSQPSVCLADPLDLPPTASCLLAQLQRLVAGSSDGPAVVQLLDELMAVAMERCSDPLLLDSSVLDRTLAASARAAAGGSAAGAQQVSLL